MTDVLDAFWEYERALMENDLPALDRLFAPGTQTLRGDVTGILVGHDAISGFRKGRGGAPKRTVVSVEVRAIDEDAALVIAITSPLTGGRGQQTQLWRRIDGAWAVEVAHVSVPAPAVNGAIWRVAGNPLVAGAASGPLAGMTVAVKDLYAVTGFAIGAGVKAFLAGAPVQEKTAPAVQALLDAGASIQGIAQTDQFAYSMAGQNPDYGTPPNPSVVGAISGGSSNGPVSAVATGQATIGLGTDTGGSIRVPASYNGLWGLRTTHGAVSDELVHPLAPTFDTVGWLTRDAATLRAAASVSLDATAQRPAGGFAIIPSVTGTAEPYVQRAIDALFGPAASAGLLGDVAVVDFGDIDALADIFRVIQGAEAWASDGEWVEAHPGALGADIAGRFAFAKTVTREQEAQARVDLAAARLRIEGILGDRVLLIPSAASIAPSVTADPEEINRLRVANLRLTSIAGITGRPALSVPLLSVSSPSALTPAPVGVCMIGPRFSDLALINLAVELVAKLA